MTVLDLRPRLAARRRRRFLRRYGMVPLPPAASSFYVANVRLALLPMMLTYVWADELQRYARSITGLYPFSVTRSAKS